MTCAAETSVPISNSQRRFRTTPAFEVGGGWISRWSQTPGWPQSALVIHLPSASRRASPARSGPPASTGLTAEEARRLEHGFGSRSIALGRVGAGCRVEGPCRSARHARAHRRARSGTGPLVRLDGSHRNTNALTRSPARSLACSSDTPHCRCSQHSQRARAPGDTARRVPARTRPRAARRPCIVVSDRYRSTMTTPR